MLYRILRDLLPLVLSISCEYYTILSCKHTKCRVTLAQCGVACYCIL